jgi:hypothetical protein
MFPFFHRQVRSYVIPAQSAVSQLAIPAVPADTTQENATPGEARAATYEELMPYLMLAMASV